MAVAAAEEADIRGDGRNWIRQFMDSIKKVWAYIIMGKD